MVPKVVKSASLYFCVLSLPQVPHVEVRRLEDPRSRSMKVVLGTLLLLEVEHAGREQVWRALVVRQPMTKCTVRYIRPDLILLSSSSPLPGFEPRGLNVAPPLELGQLLAAEVGKLIIHCLVFNLQGPDKRQAKRCPQITRNFSSVCSPGLCPAAPCAPCTPCSRRWAGSRTTVLLHRQQCDLH